MRNLLVFDTVFISLIHLLDRRMCQVYDFRFVNRIPFQNIPRGTGGFKIVSFDQFDWWLSGWCSSGICIQPG